jgi:hypothetical protein
MNPTKAGNHYIDMKNAQSRNQSVCRNPKHATLFPLHENVTENRSELLPEFREKLDSQMIGGGDEEAGRALLALAFATR